MAILVSSKRWLDEPSQTLYKKPRGGKQPTNQKKRSNNSKSKEDQEEVEVEEEEEEEEKEEEEEYGVEEADIWLIGANFSLWKVFCCDVVDHNVK